MSHTPGPWRVGELSRIFAGKKPVAVTLHWPDPISEPDNARLIAASPDMLALLKRYVADDPCAPGDSRYLDALAIIDRIEPKNAPPF